MTESSTIRFDRTSPQVARITFANPPVNLIVAETVGRLVHIVDELESDSDIQVLVFDSGTQTGATSTTEQWSGDRPSV